VSAVKSIASTKMIELTRSKSRRIAVEDMQARLSGVSRVLPHEEMHRAGDAFVRLSD
jgi:hypothetical protein